MEHDFHRITRLPPYVFSEVNAMKAKARNNGEDIIDFGMGNPDLPTPEHIVEKLSETVRNPKTHRYSNSRGIPGLRRALCSYYERRFSVSLDPEREAIVTIGSKEGLANLAQAITGPGDIILVPNPSYPIHQFGFIIADGAVRYLPVKPDSSFIPALERAIQHSVPKPVALVLCYPANPTAYVADLSFYSEVVELCRFHNIYILSDLAYAEIYFDDENPPPSVLQVPGARDITVEFTSTSKTYSMPGWRIGFAAGNEKLISALARVKSYLDYGAFTPIQVAAATALNGSQECVVETRAIYKGRRDVLIDGLSRVGWDIPKPSASMYAWAPIPKPFDQLGSLKFSKLLLEHANVAVSPGLGFGENGEGYVRIAVVENEQRIRQAVRSIRNFFSNSEEIVTSELQGNVFSLAALKK